REHRALARAPFRAAVSGHADPGAARAEPDARGTLRSVVAALLRVGQALAALVRHAVTVVVHPVAQLLRRRALAEARVPRAELEATRAVLASERAGTHPRERGVAEPAVLLRPGVAHA